MYIFEWNTYEKWAWTGSDFPRTLSYEYKNSMFFMILMEISSRIISASILLCSFGLISVINGLLIRVAIKCSVLCIFPMLYFYECALRRSISPGHVAQLYRQMGNHGAMAAYLDRNQRSKKGLILSIFTCLITYYAMYMASYSFWDSVAFNTTFTGRINNNYYFYINLLEMTTFLFVRTRSTIKYLSKYITIANLIFLVYVNSHMYAA
jgi:hypothetical protein